MLILISACILFCVLIGFNVVSSPKEVTTSEEPSTDVKVTQGTRPDIVTPEKSMPNKDQTSENDQSPSSGVSVDVSGQEKSGLEGTSPNVSSSSDMISGTPPKPNSRRQSFITLEKYVEGKSSPASVAFTGPPIRKSSRLDSSKSSECSPNDSQSQTTIEDSQKSQNISSTDPSDQNEKAMEEAKDKIKSTGGHACEGTDKEEDVVPDTQTQVSSLALGVGSSPVPKASVEEQDSPEKDSQSFVDSQSSQEPRRSSRRRSKPVRPGEDPGEMKSKEQVSRDADSTLINTPKSVLASPSSTLTGRRRSKVLEDTKVVGNKQKRKGIKGELSQSNSQIFSAESSQALPRESQTEPSPQSSPITQSDGQSRERLPTLSESENLSPMKIGTQLNESIDKEADENSQNDPQNAASSLKKKPSQAPLSDSEADSQQTVRTRRTRRSEPQLLEMSGLPTKEDLCQTDSQTVTMVKGRSTRRRTAEEEADSSRDVTSTLNADELSPSQDSSQGLGRYRTRRSKGLLTTDNTESENPDSREDEPRPKKRQRKPLPTEVLPVGSEPKVTEMVPDNEDVNIQSEVSIEISLEDADLKPETSLGISGIETKEQNDKEVLAPDSHPQEPICSEKVETVLKTDADEKEIISEKGEREEANSFSQAGSEVLKTDGLHKCPHTKGRGRGRRRSRSCNCFLNNQEVLSQNSDFQESQDLKNEQIPHAADALNCQPEHEQVPLDVDPLNSQPEQSSPISVAEKSNSSAIADFPDVDVKPFSALPVQLPCEVSSSESPITKLGVIVSQLSEAEEGAHLELSKVIDESNNVFVKVLEVETNQLESSGCADSPKQNKELDKPSVSQEPLQSSTPQDTSPSQGRPVEDAPICQEQPESSHVQQEDAVKESEDLAVSVPSGEKVVLPEESNGKELLDKNVSPIEKDKDAQIDNQALSTDIQESSSSSVLPQRSSSEACLDSPSKHKPLDALSGELEPGQSPSRNRSRVWSPSASPSTSILKKGQKRTCEEDTPSPLHKVFLS